MFQNRKMKLYSL